MEITRTVEREIKDSGNKIIKVVCYPGDKLFLKMWDDNSSHGKKDRYYSIYRIDVTNDMAKGDGIDEFLEETSGYEEE